MPNQALAADRKNPRPLKSNVLTGQHRDYLLNGNAF
jgi:hypothetical protein